jgi:hypothetical protein
MIAINKIRDAYKPEMALVILLCRIYFERGTSSEIADFIATNKIDWLLFTEIITAHKLRPFLYKVLSASSDAIPNGVLTALRAQCLTITTGNMRRREEMSRLHTLLKARGIPNVPYKGVILSQALFDDFTSRETSDIDFMIHRRHFGDAHKLLIKEGYRPRFYNPGFEKQFLNTSHELLYRKKSPAGNIKIEIHWAATSQMMSIPLPTDYLFNGLQTLKLPGGETDVFNLQNHLLLLLIHHGVNDVWRSLRDSVDIAIYLERYSDAIDWPVFLKATNAFKISHTTKIGFLIAARLFGTAIPAVFNDKVALPAAIIDNLLNYPPIRKPKLNMENLRQQLFLRDSFKDKAVLLLAYLYAGITPNIRDMEAYPLPANRYLLYYIIKPFRILTGKK